MIGDLRTPEDGLELQNRESVPKRPSGPSEAQRLREELKASKAALETATREAEGLRARLKRARQIAPTDERRHCLDCFSQGRDAAVDYIEGKE